MKFILGRGKSTRWVYLRTRKRVSVVGESELGVTGRGGEQGVRDQIL